MSIHQRTEFPWQPDGKGGYKLVTPTSGSGNGGSSSGNGGSSSGNGGGGKGGTGKK